MHYLSVTATDDPYLPFIKELYDDAFPPEERRDWQQLMGMITTTDEMWIQVIEDEGNVIGFGIFWVFDDWCFIEHLAIDPDYRGMKYGERLMQELMDGMKILLEVEPPSSADAVRRVGFYERLGFTLLPFVYRQPSYREAGISYEMKLMSNSTENDRKQFDAVILRVLQRVYGIAAPSPE